MAVLVARPLSRGAWQPVRSLAALCVGVALVAGVGCGDQAPAGDAGPTDTVIGTDMTPDTVTQPDQTGSGPEFVATVRVEQLSGGEPNFPVTFLSVADSALVPSTARGDCKIGCLGEYPDDPSIACGEPRLTPPVRLSGGPIVLDIDDDADGSTDRSYYYDFVGNDYSPAERPTAPFYPEGAILQVTSEGDPNGVPDALQAEVPGPAAVGLTSPATDDPVTFEGLDLSWAPGSGGSQAVIQISTTFQGLAMGMPTGAVVRQMSVTCTVDDTGSYTIPADVLAVLQPGAADTYFQCGGANNDACVSLTLRRENRVQKVVGKTDFTLVGSTASPTLLLTVPVMMEMP